MTTSLDGRIEAALSGASSGAGVSDFSDSQSALRKAGEVLQIVSQHDVPAAQCAFVSIGGADGTELEHTLVTSGATLGVLFEFDHALCAEARARSDRLRLMGRTVEVFEGDVTQSLRQALRVIGGWISSDRVRALVITMHAVLHELPDRGRGTSDIEALLQPFLWRDVPVLAIAREPCLPDSLPARVYLSADCRPDNLARIANRIADAHPASFPSDSRAAAMAGDVRLGSRLAIETMIKLFYIEAFPYEVQERVTSFTRSQLIGAFRNIFGTSEVSDFAFQTGSFDRFWRQLKIGWRTEDHIELAKPDLHLRVIGRWVPPESIVGDGPGEPSDSRFATAPLQGFTGSFATPGEGNESVRTTPPTGSNARSQPRPRDSLSAELSLPWGRHPFNIGTGWALNRGRYVGIASTTPTADLLGPLTHLEATLASLNANPAHPRLAMRRWSAITMDPGASADSGGHQLEAVLATAIDQLTQPNDDRVARMGLLVVVDVTDVLGPLPRQITELLARVAGTTGGLVDPAIVVQLRSDDPRRETFAADVQSALELAGMNPGAQRVVMDYTFEEVRALTSGRASNLCGPCIVDAETIDQLVADLSGFSGGLSAFSRLRSLECFPANAPTVATAGAEAVVEALDAHGPRLAPGIDRLLLRELSDQRPSLLPAFIRAYALSQRASARRDAFVVAAGREALEDLWMDSADAVHLMDVRPLQPDPECPQLATTFALSLARRLGRRGQSRLEVDVLSELLPRIQPDAAAACRNLSADMSWAFDVGGPALWDSVRRSGGLSWPSRARLLETPLAQAEFWSYLLAVPTNYDALMSVIELPALSRAVFGLCTAKEWTTLNIDRAFGRLIGAIRFGHSVSIK